MPARLHQHRLNPWSAELTSTCRGVFCLFCRCLLVCTSLEVFRVQQRNIHCAGGDKQLVSSALYLLSVCQLLKSSTAGWWLDAPHVDLFCRLFCLQGPNMRQLRAKFRFWQREPPSPSGCLY